MAGTASFEGSGCAVDLRRSVRVVTLTTQHRAFGSRGSCHVTGIFRNNRLDVPGLVVVGRAA